MNAETGWIYEGMEEIEAARERGEPLVILSPDILDELSLMGDLLEIASRASLYPEVPGEIISRRCIELSIDGQVPAPVAPAFFEPPCSMSSLAQSVPIKP
jgi:hypothetical protein